MLARLKEIVDGKYPLTPDLIDEVATLMEAALDKDFAAGYDPYRRSGPLHDLPPCDALTAYALLQNYEKLLRAIHPRVGMKLLKLVRPDLR